MDIVGIDIPCMDCLIHVNKLPEPNHGAGVLENSWQGGGKVATALAAVGRLGGNCAIIGATGSDSYGRFCKSDLEFHNVDTSHLRVHEGGATTICYVLSDEETNGRSIMGYGGTHFDFTLNEEDREFIRQAKILHLAWTSDTNLDAARTAYESGVKVTYDGDYYTPKVEDMFPYIHAFVGSEFFYDACFADHPEMDCEARCRWILDKGPEVCVFTFGPKGSVVATKDSFTRIPAAEVPKITDTVGAGDVYHGAFVFGMMQEGWSWEKIAGFAGTVATLKCMYIGGRAGIPDFNTALHFYETGEILESDIPERLKKYSTFNP